MPPKTQQQINSMSAEDRLHYWDNQNRLDDLKRSGILRLYNYSIRDFVDFIVEEEGLENLPLYISSEVHIWNYDDKDVIVQQDWFQAIRDKLDER